MVKYRDKSRRKNRRDLEGNDLSSFCEEAIALLGRRLASVAKKRFVSIFRLLFAPILILISHCRRALVAIGQLIINAWLWIVRLFHRIRLGIICAYKRFVRLCQRAINAIKQLRITAKNSARFSEYKKVKKVAVEHSTWVPFKQIRSFFSESAQKWPIRDKIAKGNGLKLLLDVLIIGVALYVLIITYLVTTKYKSFNPINSSGIAQGRKNPARGTPNKQPPLALIAYSPEPRLAAAAAPSQQTGTPHGYSFWPKRITIRHVEGWGEGISFGTDYSTLAMLWAPDYRVGRIMPMVDLRGHRFDNNTYAANIGFAGRYVPTPNTFCQILGFNVFWDWRQGRLGSYQQMGAGLEVLGKRWDLRANVYAPIAVKKRKITCSFDGYAGGYYAIHRTCEYTNYGFNAEIGNYVVRGKSFFLYAATGPYYLVRKCHDKTLGGEFRLRPQYKDYFALDLSVSHDNVFGTVYQAQIILYMPLYQISKYLNKRPCNLSDQQIYQPIERFEIMPLGRRSCWQRNF